MQINTQIIPANEFLCTTATGELDFRRAEKILLDAVGGPEQESLNILLDLREATCTPFSPAQIWSLVQTPPSHHSLHWRKMALLLNGESPGPRAELFELCAKNRGFRSRSLLISKKRCTGSPCQREARCARKGLITAGVPDFSNPTFVASAAPCVGFLILIAPEGEIGV